MGRMLSTAALPAVAALMLLWCHPATAQFGGQCVTSWGVSGVCRDLQGCPRHVALVEAIRRGAAPTSRYAELQRFICSFRGTEPLLCCPNTRSSSPATTQRPTRTPTATPAGRGGKLPSRCGEIHPDRVVGGVEAPLGSWPWMALLYGRPAPESDPQFFCGGTLIHSRYVLTAAHCIPRTAAVSLVRLGEHTKSRDIDCARFENGRVFCAPRPQDIRPTTIVKHPQYNKPGCRYCNDIALIRLARPVTMGDFVGPVCLPINPQQQMGFSAQQYTGKVAKVAGWGSVTKERFDMQVADALQQAKLQIRQCSRRKQNVICALGTGTDTCRGDSGGPLMLSDIYEQKYFQVGITSLGNPVCAAPNIQSQYTDVHRYVAWIQDNIRP